MPYFLILLLLTACTAPKAEAEKQKLEAVRAEAEKQKADAIRGRAVASADKVLKEVTNQDTASIVAQYNNHSPETINYDREDGVVPFPKATINNYLNKANPYLETYKEFFQDQLEFHGQYNDNELLIDLPKLIDINIKLQFALAPDRKNPEKTLIRIITNDKTNYYPLK